MARDIFTLVGRIRTEGLDDLQKGLLNADKKLQNAAKSFDKWGQQVSRLGVNLTKITAPLMGAAAGITALAIKTGEYADKMHDLVQITGLSTDTLQEMENVSRVAGVSFDSFVGAITKLTRQMPEIRKGTGDAAKALSQLGVNAFDATGKARDMNDLFPELIKKLQGVDNVTERNAMAMQLFGRSLADVAPILGLTGDEFDKARQEAHDLGLVMSGDALKAADEFRVSAERVKAQFTALWRELAVQFIPILQDTIVPLIQSQVIPALRGFGDRVAALSKWFQTLTPEAKDTAVRIAAMAVAAGPLLIVFGKLVSSVKILTSVIHPLMLALAANPFVAVAVAAGLVALEINRVADASIRLRDAQLKNLSTEFISQKHLDELKALDKSYADVAAAVAELNAANKTYGTDSAKAVEVAKRLQPVFDANRVAVESYNETWAEYQSGQMKDAKNRENLIATMSVTLAARAAETEAVAAETAAKEKDAIVSEAAAEAERERQARAATDARASAEARAAAEKKLFEDRKRFADEWADKRKRQGADALEIIEIDRAQAINAATAVKASKESLAAIESYHNELRKQWFIEESARTAAELVAKADANHAKAVSDAEYLRGLEKRALEATGRKLAALEIEIENEKRIAAERINDKATLEKALTDIDRAYTDQRKKIADEELEHKKKVGNEWTDFNKTMNSESVSMAVDAVNQVFALFAKATDNKIKKIDQETDKQKAAIDQTLMSEEEKAAAKELIDEQADKKKKELMYEQAKRDKAAAIFSAVVNTFQAVAKALTLGPPLGIIMAVLMGVLGAAQVAMIAAEPLPALAEGGLIQQTPGGVQATIGEGNDDEIVMPMRKGIDQIVAGILDGIAGAVLPPALPAPLAAGGESVAGASGGVTLQVGTLIADDSGLRQLERMLLKFRNEELMRKGEI